MRSTRQRWISSIGRTFGCRRKRSLRMRRLSPAAGARSLLKSPLPSRFCRPYSCSCRRSRYTAVYFLPVVCFKSKLLAGCQNVRICSRLGLSPWFMLMINPPPACGFFTLRAHAALCEPSGQFSGAPGGQWGVILGGIWSFRIKIVNGGRKMEKPLHVCPKTGMPLKTPTERRKGAWYLSLVGLLSLAWFLRSEERPQEGEATACLSEDWNAAENTDGASQRCVVFVVGRTAVSGMVLDSRTSKAKPRIQIGR